MKKLTKTLTQLPKCKLSNFYLDFNHLKPKDSIQGLQTTKALEIYPNIPELKIKI